MESPNKMLELWEGFTVEIDKKIIDDVEFTVGVSRAVNSDDYPSLIELYFDPIGGKETYDKVKEHIIEKCGYFSQDKFNEITEKIAASILPKAGNRASRRSWKSSI